MAAYYCECCWPTTIVSTIVSTQNICDLLNKKEELLHSLTRNSLQIISITEHHLIGEELEAITLHSCTLGAKVCR